MKTEIITILIILFIAQAASAIASQEEQLSITEIKQTPNSLKTGDKAVIKAYIQNEGNTTLKNVKVKFILLPEKYTGFDMFSQKAQDMMLTKPEFKQKLDGETIGEKTITTIPARQKKSTSITYTVPPKIDTLNIGVIADEAQMTKSIPVQQLFTELRITNFSFSKTNPVVGNTITVKAKLENYGTLTAKKVKVDFYASTDGKNYQKIGTKTIASIFAKKSSQATLSWKVPGAATIDFKVEANPDHAISEKNYTDNTAQSQINTSLPDITISGSDINHTGDMATGKKVKITATVHNDGEADAKNFDVAFSYLSSGGSYKTITTKKATINQGATKKLETQWTVPSDITANQVITVKVNPAGTVAESDYSNNQGTYTGTVRLPDLIVSMTARNATLSNNPAQSSGIPIIVTVTNAGTDTANNIAAKVMFSTQTVKDETIATLASGATYQFGAYHRLPYGSSPGQFTFEAMVDPSNTVNEADDNNNGATVTATATPNRPPVPKMNISNTNPAKMEWIEVSCAGSTDPDTPTGRPACMWSFEDGSEPVFDQTAFYQFATSGAHIVRLTAIDQFGMNATITGTVNVKPNQPPSIQLQPSTAYKNQESAISAACGDSDGSVTSVSWTFGDGSTDVGGCDITHSYSNTGTYTVTARATDDNGATSTQATSTVTVVNPPVTKTKSFSEVYVAHHWNPQVATSGNGPDAKIFYGIYKVDYEVKYTENDNVIRNVKYSIYSGPAIITQVTDDDPEFYFIPITAASSQGGTSMYVTRVAIQQGSTPIWSMPTYTFLSPAESPLVREFSGLEIPVDWSQHNYFTVQSTIDFPGQMCTGEGYSCQQQTALWAMS